MLVIKRDGSRETVRFDEITKRISALCYGLNTNYLDATTLAQKVVDGLFDGVSTEQIDDLTAETAAMNIMVHPDYGKLAARIVVDKLHKRTPSAFSTVIRRLFQHIDPISKLPAPMVSRETWLTVHNNAALLDKTIRHEQDYEYDYFAYKTLERSYLMKINNHVIERPQYMLMRVAVGIHGDDIPSVIETYHLLSEKWFTHATPTLFNAGTPRPQMSSCFLLTMKEDSIDGIYDTLKSCAKISQSAGGIGLAIHNVRAKGSYIKGTGGISNGIVPMLRNFDMTARYVDQGGGKRKGSIAIYLEPWHADIHDFLELKKNHGKEEMRARDLFYALWMPDLFMQRVESDGVWSLMCPNECPGLSDVYGKEFEILYQRYEREGKFREQIRAQELWVKICESQIETGNPYILYKDAANQKSNQKNLGTIKSSNLCTEIIEYTAPDEVAVCNLASLALPMFLKQVGSEVEFDYQKLYEVTYIATRNLNRVIDRNFYPVEEARNSNMRHRPIGLGVQGLADVFIKLGTPFDSALARKVNKDIFETIYFAAMTCSKDLAIKDGFYQTFPGSPLSKGEFQFDMWGVTPDSGRWDWNTLRALVIKHGVRNSLLVAPMPTASTSQILGNNECIEPYTSNLYSRRTLAGEFIIVNQHLMRDLIKLGMWGPIMKNKIIDGNGSIRHIEEIPTRLKEIYRTVWEIPQRSLIDMAADRGIFVCQSQSMNLFVTGANIGKLSSMHFHSWKRGLKTGIYYLRTPAAADAIKFTLDKTALTQSALSDSPLFDNKISKYTKEEQLACSINNPDNCETCGS